MSKWFFIVGLQSFATIVILIFFFYSHLWKYLIPLSLIISGALGNLIDRIIRGYVVDYVMWTLNFFPFNFINKFKLTYNLFNPWPIFNLADVYTITGATILFIIIIFFSKEDEKKENSIEKKTKMKDEHYDINDEIQEEKT